MFKIGEFSKIAQVSVKALHHYDDIGLFTPADVDLFTGYRRYTVDQLPRLHRILALKDLGFSLEQIAQLLDEEVSADVICSILQMKQTELEQRVEDEQARLARVTARLRLIKQEGYMTTLEVVIRAIPPIKVVSKREVMPNISHMEQRISEVYEALQRCSIQLTGPLMTLFYHTGFREQDLDVEIAVPVELTQIDIRLSDNTQLVIRQLPAVERMACLVYQGSYETLSEAYTAIGRWLAAHNYHTSSPGRELYLTSPHRGTPVTEIQFPLM